MYYSEKKKSYADIKFFHLYMAKYFTLGIAIFYCCVLGEGRGKGLRAYIWRFRPLIES